MAALGFGFPFRTGPDFCRRWTPLTSVDTERKMEIARDEAEFETIKKARARRERRAASRAMQRAA